MKYHAPFYRYKTIAPRTLVTSSVKNQYTYLLQLFLVQISKKYLQNKLFSYNRLKFVLYYYLKFFLILINYLKFDLIYLVKSIQKIVLKHHKLISLETSNYIKYNIITFQVLPPTNLSNSTIQLLKEPNKFSYNSVSSMTTNIHCNYNA